MDFIRIERPSDSPFVELIWRSQNRYDGGEFISTAQRHWEMVMTRYQGTTTITIRGPETRATPASGPGETEVWGIQFKPGVFMPHLPPGRVMDRRDLNLPEADGQSFWMHGSAWKYPTYENAEIFINRLIREGLLVNDPVVSTVLQGEPVGASLRTIQRRVLRATGLTYAATYQIERAHYATSLLKQGVSILDTVEEAGYFDQPHLTRSLKHFMGLTPAQILDQDRTERLSYLYKTIPTK